MIWSEKHEVVISRHLKPYAMRIEVWPEDIELGMALEDFLASLVKEMDKLPWRLTKEELLKRLQDSSLVVCDKMKKEILQVLTTGA